MVDREKVRFLFNRAEFNRQDNNHLEAIRLYTEGINQYSNWTFDSLLEKCYLGRCNSYLEIGEYKKAASDCAEIVKYDLNNPNVWLSYGIASFELKKFRESLEYLKYSKELSKDPVLALAWIAHVNLEIGEYQEALLNVNKALQINPKYEWGAELVKKIASKMAKQKEEERDFSKWADFFEESLQISKDYELLPFTVRRIPKPLQVKALVALSAMYKDILERLFLPRQEKILISDYGKYVLILFQKSYLLWNLEEDKKVVYYESETNLYDVCFLNNEELLVIEDTGRLKRISIPENKVKKMIDLQNVNRGTTLDVSADRHLLSIKTDKKIFLVDVDSFEVKELRLGGNNIKIDFCFFSSIPNSIFYSWRDIPGYSFYFCLFDYVAEKKIFEQMEVEYEKDSRTCHSIEGNACLYRHMHYSDDEDSNTFNVNYYFEYYNLDNQDLNFSVFCSGEENFAYNQSIIGIDTHGTQFFLVFDPLQSPGLLAIFDARNRTLTIHHVPREINEMVKFPNSREFIFTSDKMLYYVKMD